MDHGPGLLASFGNQFRVLFAGVGAVAARSAAVGPRSFDRLADLVTDAIIITQLYDYLKVRE